MLFRFGNLLDLLADILFTLHAIDRERSANQFVWNVRLADDQEKKGEIWLRHMTKAPTPTEKSKKQRDNTKTLPKLGLHNDCGPT